MRQEALLEVERRFEENTRKLTLTERDLDKAEERAAAAENKIKKLEADLMQALTELKTYAHQESSSQAADQSALNKLKATEAALREVRLLSFCRSSVGS
jgi:tropomyosin 1